MIGIVSYGFYIPKYRIRTEEICGMWGKNPEEIKTSLGINEKTVSSIDEDSLTMAYESSIMALSDSGISPKKIQAVFFGSETPPYIVNPSSTILAEFLGIERKYFATDLQFACKAATGGIISSCGLISSKEIEYSLVSASDRAVVRPHDSLEYSAASGSVSLLLGKKNVLLEVVAFESFSSDTPDFWRREGIRYPSHGGRFTGKPSYFYHIQESAKNLFHKTGLKPRDFKYTVFHMPNGRFPQEAAFSLGFTKEQIDASLIVCYLGNSYTASGLMGLCAVLEKAKAGDFIFFASYGSGAGSDTFIFKVTKGIDSKRRKFKSIMDDKQYINYQTYLKFMEII